MKLLILVYGTLSYLVFFGSFLYLIGFVESIVVPKNINMGPPGTFLEVIAIDLGLIALFGVSHSVMARPAFKEQLTKVIHPAAERSTFVLVASLSLCLMFWLWRPLTRVIWSFDGLLGTIIFTISMIGWVIVLYSTFLIDHFDLFGMRQVWLHFCSIEYSASPFVVRGLYKFCRHPLMLGFLIAFWFTPNMTYGHLLFAVAMSAYIFIGIWHEERDLEKHLGDDYLQYRQRTTMLFPWISK